MTNTSKDNNELWNNYEMVKRYYDQQTLGELTASKCKAKTAFTKAKHELTRLLKQSPSHKDVQKCQSNLDECKRNVLAVQVKLASEYKKSEYKQCWKNTVKETDTIKEEYEEAHKMAERYLGRTLNSMPRRPSDNFTSGAESFVTEDECTEVRINDGSIQDLDLNFGKLDALDSVKDERRRGDDLYAFQSIDQFKPLQPKPSSDDSVFEDELKFLRDGRRQNNFHRSPFTQSMREIRVTDRTRKTKDSYTSELSEEDRRIRSRRKKNLDHLSQSTIEKGTRERTLSWDSSTVEDEKRGRDLRRLRAPPTLERIKQDNWSKSRRRLSGDVSVFKGIDHKDWNLLEPEREDSPFVYKGIEHYQDPHDSYAYLEKENNSMKDYSDNRSTLFQPTTVRRGLRKHVSFGGFDFKKDPFRESLRSKRNSSNNNNTLSQEYIPESLITVIENTKSFIKYNKVRVKLLEVLDTPMPRRNKIKELQEMMRSAYNKLQDDIYILSEEYKRDIKKHEAEMMSAYNMAQSYLELKDNSPRSASSTSIGDLSLKDLPRKKVLRKSLTTDDLLVKFNR